MRKSIALFVCVLVVHPLFAQAEQPSAAYMRSLNSYVRGAPETSQMMKFIDYPVNLFTGTPNISLPISYPSPKRDRRFTGTFLPCRWRNQSLRYGLQ